MTTDNQAPTFDDLRLEVFDYVNENFGGKPVMCAVNLGGSFAVQVTGKGLKKYPAELQPFVDAKEIQFEEGGHSFAVSSPEDFRKRALNL